MNLPYISPCSQGKEVPCYVARAKEKTLFIHYIFYTSCLGLLLIICESVKKVYTLIIQSRQYRRLFHTKTLTQTAIKDIVGTSVRTEVLKNQTCLRDDIIPSVFEKLDIDIQEAMVREHMRALNNISDEKQRTQYLRQYLYSTSNYTMSGPHLKVPVNETTQNTASNLGAILEQDTSQTSRTDNTNSRSASHFVANQTLQLGQPNNQNTQNNYYKNPIQHMEERRRLSKLTNLPPINLKNLTNNYHTRTTQKINSGRSSRTGHYQPTSQNIEKQPLIYPDVQPTLSKVSSNEINGIPNPIADDKINYTFNEGFTSRGSNLNMAQPVSSSSNSLSSMSRNKNSRTKNLSQGKKQ